MPTETTTSVNPEFLDILTAGMASAPEPPGDGSLPDGDYTARFLGPRTGLAKRTGTAYFNLEFEVLGPAEELVGTPASAHFNLITPQNFEIFKKQVRRMGVEGNSGTEILAELQGLVGAVFQITAKTNKTFHNLYVNKRIRQD